MSTRALPAEFFPLPLRLERTAPRRGVLLEPFVFCSPSLGRIEVEKGFDTDYATVPRIFWTFYPPDGAYTEGAVVHDCLYWYQAIAGRPIEREQADLVFLETMVALGIPWARRHVIHSSVRIGGWIAWNKNKGKAGL